MAQLKSGSTVGGNSILTTASSVGFPAGTVMVFYQAAAPTGWTKSIAHNNKALRVVSGVGGGYGGTHALTSPPSTSHTHTGPSHTHSTPSHSHSHTLSAGAHTLTLAETPSHTHSGSTTFGHVPGNGGWGTIWVQANHSGYKPAAANSGSAWASGSNLTISDSVRANGSGLSHSHSLAGSITSGGSGTSGAGGTGATGSAGPTAFAPRYINVIVCSKN